MTRPEERDNDNKGGRGGERGLHGGNNDNENEVTPGLSEPVISQHRFQSFKSPLPFLKFRGRRRVSEFLVYSVMRTFFTSIFCWVIALKNWILMIQFASGAAGSTRIGIIGRLHHCEIFLFLNTLIYFDTLEMKQEEEGCFEIFLLFAALLFVRNSKRRASIIGKIVSKRKKVTSPYGGNPLLRIINSDPRSRPRKRSRPCFSKL